MRCLNFLKILIIVLLLAKCSGLSAQSVGNVSAEELSGDAVHVNWLAPGSTISDWLYYDNGANEGSYGMGLPFSWGIKFDPNQLTPYAGTSLTKLLLITNDINTIQIFQGPNAETLVYEQEFTDTSADLWTEVELTTPVPIDITKELWITLYHATGNDATYPAGIGYGMGEPNGDLFTTDGITWEHLLDVFGWDNTWNLRGFVTDSLTNRSMELGEVHNSAVYQPNAEMTFQSVKNTTSNTAIDVKAHQGNRELTGYNVYRTTCATGDLEFLGFTTDEAFTDNSWGAAEAGVYKWGVVALYDENTSDIVFSNCLDKNMTTRVSVAITCNSLDSPAGTGVMFTNISEPSLALVYNAQLDETGTYAWDDFRKGTYDITCEKSGFVPISLTNYIIDDPEDFEWVLEELVLSVSELHVNPSGYATWTDALTVSQFTPVIESFNDGVPAGWTIEAGPTSLCDLNWEHKTEYGGHQLDGTPFMMISADICASDMDGILNSLEINASGTDALYLEFDQYYQDLFGTADVEVFDGTNWVLVLHQAGSNVGSWAVPDHQVIDVSAYANASFRVRFHFWGAWMFGWAIDNVSVTNVLPGQTRSFQNYRVYLDGVLVTEVADRSYQYGANGEVLVDGQTYLAEVSAVYSTGESEKAGYNWTYIACDNYPVAENFAAVQLDGTDDVSLTWTIPVIPPDDDQIAFARIYRNGEVLAEVTESSYLDDSLDFSTYTYCITFVYESGAETCPASVCQTVAVVIYNLYVTPTGYATWGDSLIGNNFIPVFENFNNGVPAGWTIEEGPTALISDNWMNVTDYEGNSLDGTPFMIIHADPDVDGILNSAVFDASGTGSLYLEFDQYYWKYWGNAEVEVFDGTNWVLVLDLNANTGSWTAPDHQIIDVSAYANDAFRVRFHYWGAWMHFWAIDNVSVTNVAPVADRSFQNYKVYNDGVLVAEVTDRAYQFGSNGEVLIDGQTYLAEVSAVYTTGESEKAGYTWTYTSCNNFPAPENFAAVQLNNTYNVSLTWTTPTIPPDEDQIAFARIYRDGEVLAEVSENSYLDESLTFGTYTYCITFVYESGAETCPATVCETVTISTTDGLVNGNVKEAAYLGGANLAWAEVLLTNMDNITLNYSFITDTDGNYSGEVPAGTYTYMVSANGYATASIEDVYIGASGIVTNNFELMEFPYPVSEVTATELSGDAVQVSWGAGSGTVSDWLYYDNGANEGSYGMGLPFSWGIKFDPNQLTPYAGTSLTKLLLITNDINTIQIFQGPNAETLVYEQEFTDTSADLWTEVELTTPVPIDITKELWITLYHATGNDATYPAGIGYGMGEPNGDLFTTDGITWEHLLDVFGWDNTWNLRGFVTDSLTNRSMELGEVHNSAVYQPNAEMTFQSVKNTTSNTSIDVKAHQGNRELTGYNVYRTTCATGDLEFLGFTTDEAFTDNSWGAAEAGLYKWGVVAVYEENASEILFSDCLDKIIEECISPVGLEAVLAPDPETTILTWNMPLTSNTDKRTTGELEGKSFLGFNIYRDDVQLNSELVIGNIYQDTPGTPGHYCYKVTAVYSLCGESEPSNEACIDVLVGVDENQLSGIEVYPNPANGMLNLTIPSGIKEVKMCNQFGQEIKNENVNGQTSIHWDLGMMPGGTYLLRFVNDKGIVFNKKVVIL